jgi:hypothetical protein
MAVVTSLCSHLDEKRDSNEGNNYERSTSDEHVANIISCGAPSHGYLVVFSDDRTFMRIHWILLSRNGRNSAKPPIAATSGALRLFHMRPSLERRLNLAKIGTKEGFTQL